jgi:hypothetical protein
VEITDNTLGVLYLILPSLFSLFRAYDLTLVEKIDCSNDGVIIFACTSVETARVAKQPGRTRNEVKVREATGKYKNLTERDVPWLVTWLDSQAFTHYTTFYPCHLYHRGNRSGLDPWLDKEIPRTKTTGHHFHRQLSPAKGTSIKYQQERASRFETHQQIPQSFVCLYSATSFYNDTACSKVK